MQYREYDEDNDDNPIDDREAPDPSDMDDEQGDDADGNTEPCPFCGAAIYHEVDVCPRCGNFILHDVPPSRPVWWIVAFVIALVIAVLWAISP